MFIEIQGGSYTFVDQCTAGCETHANFADESVCLLADNVGDEVLTVHRLQVVLRMLSLYT
jgi:hypothetical protein